MPIPEYLYATHDADGAPLMAGFAGWVIITEAIGHDPNDHSGKSYADLQRLGLGVMIRLNNAHNGVDGTIPLPEAYADFAKRCANFVAASTGIDAVIIGNEPNISGERPPDSGGKKEIKPNDYTRCYLACYRAIKQVAAKVKVLVAAIAPWNMESGDWLEYLRSVAMGVGDDTDGFALHAYTHGTDPNLITSDEKQHGWYWHFRTYRDQLNTIWAARVGKRQDILIGITESDQNDPWLDTNSGWLRRAYEEISAWNQQTNMPIAFLTIYRANRDDKWSFADKPGVQQDFRAAVEQGYKAPQISAQSDSEKVYIPKVSTGNDTAPGPKPEPELPPRDIDPRAAGRGTRIQSVDVKPGQQFWRVRRLYTPNEEESDALGPDRHILANVLVDGQRQVGTPLQVTWGGGGPAERATIYTKNNPGYEFSADQLLTPGPFTLAVADGKPSEVVTGIKMGMETEQGFNPGIHTSTLADFELVTMPATQPAQPSQPTHPAPAQPDKAAVPQLAHPVHDPKYRVVTQAFGANEAKANYQEMGLAGHDGVDFGTPVGSVVDAVDDGQVIEADILPDYGNVIKIRHTWGESVYAHLNSFMVHAGDFVKKGEQIATSGASGNAEGPHLHFGMRIFPYQRGYPYDGFSDPMPYLTGQPSTPADDATLLQRFQDAGREFGVPWTLLASQAWAESSFDPKAVSSDGAQGLMQIMPKTWAEWAPKIGAGNDPFDPYQNIRVAARYLQWLLSQTDENVRQALIAYGWGIGNLQGGQPKPAQWVEYSNKIVHGEDLLDAVLPMIQ